MTRPAARVARVAAVAIPLGFLGLFFAYPVGSILARGLVPGGHLDLGPVGEVFTDPGLRGIAWFTVWQAALSTLLTVLIALPPR